MLRHSFLFIFRSFNRHKSTFLINFIGLSTGLASALFIYLWVLDELHTDHANKNDSHLYQVLKNAPGENGISTSAQTPGRLGEALIKEIPEIEFATSVTPSEWFGSKGIVSYENDRIKASAQFVSTDYFNFFSFEFIQGSREKALSEKYNTVISEEAL